MKAFEIAGLPRDEVSRFVRGIHSDPFRVLAIASYVFSAKGAVPPQTWGIAPGSRIVV